MNLFTCQTPSLYFTSSVLTSIIVDVQSLRDGPLWVASQRQAEGSPSTHMLPAGSVQPFRKPRVRDHTAV